MTKTHFKIIFTRQKNIYVTILIDYFTWQKQFLHAKNSKFFTKQNFYEFGLYILNKSYF